MVTRWLWGFLYRRWYNRKSATNVASISNKHSTIRGFNVVTVVWTNCCDYSVYVPAFSGGVLDSDIGASGQLR